MALDAAVLVLSDLHLGESIDGETELPPINWSRAARFFASQSGLDNFFIKRCAAHNKAVLRRLPTYLEAVIGRLRVDEGFSRGSFDHCLLLGDLVTWPSLNSFDFLRQYLFSDRVQSLKKGGGVLRGLNLDPKRVTAIPGNHDKLLRRTLARYNQYFASPAGLPTVTEQGAAVVDAQFGSVRAGLLTIDANQYTSDKDLELNLLNARRHLAAGIASDGLILKIRELLPSLLDPKYIVRGVVLHFAVDDALGAAAAFTKLVPSRLPHGIKDLQRLLNELPFDKLDFLIHGHLHRDAVYNCGAPTVSVGSTSQLSTLPASFCVLKRYASGQIQIEYHKWRGTGFTKNASAHLNRPLN